MNIPHVWQKQSYAVQLCITLLFVMGFGGCSIPRTPVPGSGLMPAPLLGIVVDKNLVVMGTEFGSPAETADIQVGDILIDITPTTEGTPTATTTNADTIPFTDTEQADNLIMTGRPLILRLQRGDAVIEIQIQAAPPAPRRNMPTATPMWPPNDLF